MSFRIMNSNASTAACSGRQATRLAPPAPALRAYGLCARSLKPTPSGNEQTQFLTHKQLMCRMAASASSAQPVAAAAAPSAVANNEGDLSYRHAQVLEHFPSAMGIDDFMARVEVVLAGYGFTGDNTISMTNLCRDEVTQVLKDKIESSFGSSFNTNGLGAVLTCGVTGMGAGLSHSPICTGGRERYVFFAFPHIGIDSKGQVGAIARPGRSGTSCACGALAKALGEFTAEGYSGNCKVPGVHDAMDPEYSILKQRLARRLRYERADVTQLDLAKITAVAERTITNDLEYLIEKAVDTSKADYAVVTGVQIHNWAADLESGVPSMEFAAPTKVYVCVNGQKINLDLSKVPPLSPRQLMLLAASSTNSDSPIVGTVEASDGLLQEIPFEYLQKRMGGASGGAASSAKELPAWQNLYQSATNFNEWDSLNPIESEEATAAKNSLAQLGIVHPEPTLKKPSAAAAAAQKPPQPQPQPVAGSPEDIAALEKALAAAPAPEPAKAEEKKGWFGLW